MSKNSVQDNTPCRSKTGAVTRKTGNKSASSSAKGQDGAAMASRNTRIAWPKTDSRTPSPEAESCLPSHTSITTLETATPATSRHYAKGAILPTTPTTMPKPESEQDLQNKDFSMGFSLVASYAKEYPYGDESLYKDCICEVMMQDGWNIKKEVRTEFGIADLVARRDMETWVMEAKISNDNNSIAHACGQLLFYTAAIPFTKRIIATPHRLPSFSLYKAMRLNGIEPFEFTDYYFPAKRLFDKKSLLKRHRNMIEESMIAMNKLMLFLSDEEPIQDADTVKRWLALAGMCDDAKNAIESMFGKSPRLAVVRNDAA